LFRIVQEGMSNVIRHSHASNMQVRLIQQDNRLILQLSDDGCGFDADMLWITDDSGKGLGLRGIQERAGILGGTFDLQTAPEHGTIITIAVPLLRQENAHG
jgi:signal transduction histidine kinase